MKSAVLLIEDQKEAFARTKNATSYSDLIEKLSSYDV